MIFNRIIVFISLAGAWSPVVEAFQSTVSTVDTPSARHLGGMRAVLPKTRTTPAFNRGSALGMSDIPEDEDDFTSLLTKIPRIKFEPPEDMFALVGDVLTLFVYSYADHIANEAYAASVAESEALAFSQDLAGNMDVSLPVWFDHSNLYSFGPQWLAHQQIEIPYAPAIAASGLSFVLFSSVWILCGCLSGAFQTENTLECKTSRSLEVTGRTWVFASIVMIALALGSDALWGQLDEINALSAPARGGLTRADADYIFDSLSVLAFWRFLLNGLFGYRRK